MDDQMADGHRITNSDIDRRVGHLEEVQTVHGDRLHELGNELQVVKLQVEHSQALMRSKFEQNLSATSAIDAKLDRLIDRLGAETRGFTELTASPAGRMVRKELDDLKDNRQSDASRIKRVEDRLMQASAVVALIAFLMPLLAPLIAGWVGLPK